MEFFKTEAWGDFYRNIRPLLPAFIAVAIFSLTIMYFFSVKVRQRKMNPEGMGLFNIFFCLDTAGSVTMAASFVKLVMVIVFLVDFSELSVLQYTVFLFTGIVASLQLSMPKHIPANLFWLLLELIGMYALKLICGYYKEVSGELLLVILYIVMSLLVLLWRSTDF